MKFNENLKYLRKKEGFTQESLAEKLNVSRQAVTKWESGQALPDLVNLKEIADLFGVTLDELLGNEKSKNNTTLNKKLKDLPLFVLGDALFFCIMMIEFGIKNLALIYISLIIFAVILSFDIIHYIKSKKIINLTNTSEGRKERAVYIAKNTLYTTIWLLAWEVAVVIVRKIGGLEIYNSIEDVFVFIFVVILAIFAQIIDMKNKVKKFNEER